MAPETTIGIEVHLLNTHYGAWCQPCALPSAVEVEFAWVNSRTLRIGGRVRYIACLDCGSEKYAYSNQTKGKPDQ